jgi:hypothetical protein
MSEQALEIVVGGGFNYYNYFTEVEEAFVARRGAPMLISPLDWALIESWKTMGIPLHIVLRGITKSFEGYAPETNRGKKVNTLFYCQQEVLSNFKDYVDSQVGAAAAAPSVAAPSAARVSSSPIFPKQELIDFIESRREELEQARAHALRQGYANLPEALWRASARLAEIIGELGHANAINTEGLERDLTILEDLIYESLRQDAPESELETIRIEAEQQLRPHKKRMEAKIYQQTLENYIAKRLREQHFISRLSLFYM